MNTEEVRLEEARRKEAAWLRWGPYLSERQWGTVREDYSAGGDTRDLRGVRRTGRCAAR